MKYKYLNLEDTIQAGDEWIVNKNYKLILSILNGRPLHSLSEHQIDAWKIRRPIKKLKLG